MKDEKLVTYIDNKSIVDDLIITIHSYMQLQGNGEKYRVEVSVVKEESE